MGMEGVQMVDLGGSSDLYTGSAFSEALECPNCADFHPLRVGGVPQLGRYFRVFESYKGARTPGGS